MVFAMLLGGLPVARCSALVEGVRVADRSLFVADGKGDHQRVELISNVFSSRSVTTSTVSGPPALPPIDWCGEPGTFGRRGNHKLQWRARH